MSKEALVSHTIKSFELSEIPREELKPFEIVGEALGIKLIHGEKIEIWTLEEEDSGAKKCLFTEV